MTEVSVYHGWAWVSNMWVCSSRVDEGVMKMLLKGGCDGWFPWLGVDFSWVGVNKVGVNKVGVNKVGVNKVGVNKVGVNKVGEDSQESSNKYNIRNLHGR